MNRRQFLKWGTAAGAVGLAGYGTIVEPGCLSLERLTVRIRNLPTGLEGLRIAILSDFHLHPFTTLPVIEESVRLANSLRPDLVVLLGDYVDATVDAIDELAPVLERLNARLGVFGVLGNHDHWKGAARVQATLEKIGIPIMRNSTVPIETGGACLLLAGLESLSVWPVDLRRTLPTHLDGMTTILLVHEPDSADVVSLDGRISLQLSGHSHGGQVCLPGVGPLLLPPRGRKYPKGLYHVRDLTLYTTRGVGLVNVPMRFNCPPEVTEITLTAS